MSDVYLERAKELGLITEENIGKVNPYELVRNWNKADNLACLKSLGIEELKKDAAKAFGELKPAPKKRKLTLKPKPTVLRRSNRIKKVPPDFNASTLSSVSLNIKPESYDREEKPRGPLPFAEHAFQPDATLTTKFLEDFHSSNSDLPTKSNVKLLPQYLKQFKSMKIDSTLVEKVVESRSVALSVHPSTQKNLVAAGSKYGQIGFWDVNKRHDGVYVYEPHSERVTCLEFSPFNPMHIFSSSFDGTLRCGDLEKAVFDEVFRVPNDDLCSSFDFLSPSTFLVSHRNGTIAVVDQRTNTSEGDEVFHVDYRLNTVHVHPVQKEQFIGAGLHSVCLWDLRKMKSKKPISEYIHPKSVNSAYFSPITGKYILSTSLDNRLNVLDAASCRKEISLIKSIPHNNHTGRWLTPFRAVWLSNNEDAFMVGCMSYPRRIQVFQTNGDVVHEFNGEDLGSICCINALHPSNSFLAGGNSSGKVHVFMASV